MNRYVIEYESYLGRIETTTIYADTERDARRIFDTERPLSEIRNVDCYEN